LALHFGGQTIKYREFSFWIKLGGGIYKCVVIGNDISFCGQDILCNFMEGLGMKEMKNLVYHYNQWFEENKMKSQEVLDKISEIKQRKSAESEMKSLGEDSDYKSFPGISMYVSKGDMEKVIRESLSDFELKHLEVRITPVVDVKYSVEVDYGVDSFLIRRDKTLQSDKSNKYIEGGKSGDHIRVLKCSSFDFPYCHYRVDTRA